MQVVIGQVRLEDASHLKPVIGKYTVPDPDDEDLVPPIAANSHKSHARMGLKHLQLARMLCPVKYLAEYSKNPQGYPSMVYSNNILGEDFDPKQVQKGLHEDYLIEQVMKHLFTGPSTALSADGESIGTQYVTPVFMSHFTIGLLDKWKETDGTYNYCDTYYWIISTICKAPDPSWLKALHEHWNLQIFKNKLGLHISSSSNITNTDDDNDNNFALMQKQYEERLADEATTHMVSSTSVDSGPGENLPTAPKSPSMPLITFNDDKSDADTSNPCLPPKIPPPSLVLNPWALLPLVSVKEPSATAELSDLSEPDKVWPIIYLGLLVPGGSYCDVL
ncbi:hypothetical protein BDR04DRAFT_1163814 [Suillus decipiens]|nr:hypothetical protein BDR04DRAFT_1163814 [Suillus decipiens]